MKDVRNLGWIGLLLCVPLGSAVCSAQESDEADESALQAQLQKHYLELAKSVEFFADQDKTQPLELIQQPISSWTSIENGFVSGDVFVWTRDGRAALIACFGSLPTQRDFRLPFMEYHALGEEILPSVTVNDRPWSPSRPGVEFQSVVDGVPPSDSPVRRLAEMRRLVRQFEVTMEPDAGGTEELRLQTRPIYRYDPAALKEGGDVVDGAIFSFVSSLGTDPELLLLVEARGGEEARWHYAPIRFTTRVLSVKRNGEKVWSCEHYHAVPRAQHRQSPYITELTEPWRVNG